MSGIGKRGLHQTLQSAASDNLSALLAGAPPIALPLEPLDATFGTAEPDPLAGLTLAAWQSGQLPDDAVARRVLQQPDLCKALSSPRSGLGSELLVPRLLRQSWTDGALRHALAQACRVFLSDKVLFHPGAPPEALFSPAALGVLCLAQPGQLDALSPQATSSLRAAGERIAAEDGPPPAWDQWLYRRISETEGWQLEARLVTLPWVRWVWDEPLPEPLGDAGLPAYWPSLLQLDL